MKNLSLLQKKASMALFLCMSVGLFSCSTEEEFSPVNEKVIPALEVSKMSDWLPNTRSSFDESDDMPVLHFKDEQACNETIAKLNERSEEHTSELQSRQYLVCRLLLEKKNYTGIVKFEPN